MITYLSRHFESQARFLHDMTYHDLISNILPCQASSLEIVNISTNNNSVTSWRRTCNEKS